MKVHKLHIYNEIYGKSVYIVLNMPADKFEQHLRKRFDIEVRKHFDFRPEAGAFLYFKQWPHSIIWLKEFSKTPDGISKLSHELFHLTLHMCSRVGVPTSSSEESVEDEAAAYLFEFYMREVLRRV